MVERKKALLHEPPELRREREEIQSDEAEGDEELIKIHQAIRCATEDTTGFDGPGQPASAPEKEVLAADGADAADEIKDGQNA